MSTTHVQLVDVGRTLVRILVGIAVLSLAAPLQAGERRKHGCEFDLRDFEPKSADTRTLSGRDAVLFYEAIRHDNQPVPEPSFDRVVLKSGPDVVGGTVALIAKGNCVLGHGFFSVLDYIHAAEIVQLYAARLELKPEAHLDLARLRAMADAGDPVAQLHVGLTLALGWGAPQDRGAGVSWLRQSAESGYAPAMLALGMALSGPGSLEDESIRVGAPPRTDQFTDRAQACYWLKSAAASSDRVVQGAANHELEWRKLESLMTSEERAECELRLRTGK